MAIQAAKQAIRDRSERTYSEIEITELAQSAVAGIVERYRLEDRTFDDFRFGFEVGHLLRSPAYNSATSLSVAIRGIIESMGWALVPKMATDPGYIEPTYAERWDIHGELPDQAVD